MHYADVAYHVPTGWCYQLSASPLWLVITAEQGTTKKAHITLDRRCGSYIIIARKYYLPRRLLNIHSIKSGKLNAGFQLP